MVVGIEAALLKVGASVATSAGSAWIKSRTRSKERATSLLDLATKEGLGIIPVRRLNRQFEQLAERISTRLEPIVDAEFQALQSNDKVAALLLVADTIDEVDLSDSALLSANVSTVQIGALIQPIADGKTARAGLGNAGNSFYYLVLREVVAYIAEIVSSLPAFQGRALAEILVREDTIIDQLRQVLDRMPALNLDVELTDISSFDLEYKRDAARKLDQVELFGVTLSGPSRRYPLSVAYIGLQASQSVERMKEYAGESDKARVELIDEVLSNSPRTYIRGEAGSGKSTLLRWLALRMAQSSLGIELQNWNDHVPFLIELRRYAETDLPSPGGFISTLAWHLSDKAPSGWAYDRLSAGRAVVLVDGLDEFPRNRLGEVRSWLNDLVSAFAQAKYVVTSRPGATSVDWLESEGFEAVDLLPMNDQHIVSFIDHWHDAVAMDLADDDVELLRIYQRMLVAAVRKNRAIRGLATNPLLCALLCALNRDRRGKLPTDRIEIYRTAIEMLLTRRDSEREAISIDIELNYSEKLIVLEELAYWFTLNELSDAAVDRVKDRVASSLGRMPGKNVLADDVYQSLLLRSGLIREPIPGRTDFIHKTFQEYLAGRFFVDNDLLNYLIRNCHHDNYREVIVMAAGHARKNEVEHLIKSLLDKSERKSLAKGKRARLQLLCITCLEVATRLDPKVYKRVMDCLRSLIPPTSLTDSKSLAGVGEDLISLLPRGDEETSLTEEAASAVIHAAALVGGSGALDLLATYKHDSRPRVEAERLLSWRYFDPVEYASKVIDPPNLPDGWNFRFYDSGVLPGLRLLPANGTVTCNFAGPVSYELMSTLGSVSALKSLSVKDNPELSWLGFLENCNELRELKVVNCPIRSLGGLYGLPLTALSVDAALQFSGADIETLCSLDRLQSLRLRLDDLYILSEVMPPISVRRLELVGVDAHSLEEISEAKNVDHLSVESSGTLTEIGDLALFSNLRSLLIYDCPNLRSISSIASLRQLRRLSIKWCDSATSFASLSALDELRFLDLENTGVYNLSFVSTMKELTSLNISECRGIKDLTPILNLPSLKTLNIKGCRGDLDLSALSALSGVTVIHDGMLYSWEYPKLRLRLRSDDSYEHADRYDN